VKAVSFKKNENRTAAASRAVAQRKTVSMQPALAAVHEIEVRLRSG
jgi:hypothetical protein